MNKILKTLATGSVLAAFCSAPAIAQSDETRAEQYARLAELPPFEGVWQADWGMVTQLRQQAVDAPLTDEAREQYRQFQQAKEEGRNVQTSAANCLPTGLPNAMRLPYPMEIIYSPGKVNVIIETHSQYRQLWTDGRDLPEDPDRLFNGTSVAHWEGDELVVETVGLSPQTTLIEGIAPTPDTLVRERIRLAEPDRMVIETTITDPALFTEPYTTELNYNLEPDWDIREYVCQENNRDAADEQGRPSMDLGFDELDSIPDPDEGP